MKGFASSMYLLRNARREVRIVYTAFLALLCIGLLTTAVFEFRQIGPTPGRIAAYYLGGERGGEMTFAKTFRELVEVTHFHAFIMSVIYLILAHLVLATAVPPSIKNGLIIASFVGIAADLLSPWLIRYGSASFAYLQVGAWLGEWLGIGGLIVVPVGEMWFSNVRDEIPPE